MQAGEPPGAPRVKSSSRSDRCTYTQVGNGATLATGVLVLSKIGRLALRWSRPLEGTPKTVTLSRQADGWYACFSCAEVPTQPLPLTGQQTGTGIDVGLQVFLVSAEGEHVEHPRHSRRAERQLRRAQRRVSRPTQGSTRRRKAVALLKRAQQRVQRQRRALHHTAALRLLQTDDTIVLEDLRVANLLRSTAHLATSISDASWAQLRTILAGNAAYAGRRVVGVPPASTSQDCSGCGERVSTTLSVRTQVCPCCGLVRDRDENAALTMLRAGQAPQAPTWPGAASVA